MLLVQHAKTMLDGILFSLINPVGVRIGGVVLENNTALYFPPYDDYFLVLIFYHDPTTSNLRNCTTNSNTIIFASSILRCYSIVVAFFPNSATSTLNITIKIIVVPH